LAYVHRGDIELLAQEVLWRFLDVHQLFFIDKDFCRGVRFIRERRDLALVEFPGDACPGPFERHDLLFDVLVLIVLDDRDAV